MFFFISALDPFRANDPQVKLEPGIARDNQSPYFYAGTYRENQLTPSPQPPNSPLNVFNPIRTSPSTYQPPPNILQSHLQRPAQMPSNQFDQTGQANSIFVPNIPTQTFVPGTSAIWSNGNNVTTNGGRTYTNLESSNIFNQPMPGTSMAQQQTFTPNFSTTQEPMMNSSGFDLGILDNLSGELQNFSLSDFQMDSFSKTGEKAQKKPQS